MRRMLRSIVVALFLAETLLLANGLLLVRLAKSLSTPAKVDREDAVRELPRSITAKWTLPTIVSSEEAFRVNPHKPVLPVVGKWEMHAWINEERVTNQPLLIYDHNETTETPLPIEHDDFLLTIDPGAVNAVRKRKNLTSLPSEVCSFIRIQWTEKSSTKLEMRALCKLELHSAYVEQLARNHYDVSLTSLWESIAEHRPENEWSRWETPSSPNAEPNVLVTVQPEAVRKCTIGLLPEVHLHPYTPLYRRLVPILDVPTSMDAEHYVDKGRTRIPCRVIDTGEAADCNCLHLELLIQLTTPKKPKEPPMVSILMWPAKASAWPSL